MNLGSAWSRVQRTIDRTRERSGLLDHVMATVGHYGRVDGNGQAGAVTYFAFLAFFPIMALMFFVVGFIAGEFPDAKADLERIISDVLPGLIGPEQGQVELDVFSDNAARAGILGALGFVYAGLGWISALRVSLQTLFEKPQKDLPNLFVGKARDLMTLAVVGLLLLLAMAVTSAVNSFSDETLNLVDVEPTATLPDLGLRVLGAVLAVALITGLLMALYQLLARPRVSHRALREGAVLAAVGFVLLKLVADRLIELTEGQPAFTVFGFALVLLVLINYFSRVVMFGAAWAHTSKRTPDLFEDEPVGPHWRQPS
ncbi:MAG TPA: YihY/virulence factor BrkB family protein [Nocardioidaceae bacterium]|nr:YihY/virulence factor BrkB family protein [Nocardioidaceae bacterium]